LILFGAAFGAMQKSQEKQKFTKECLHIAKEKIENGSYPSSPKATRVWQKNAS